VKADHRAVLLDREIFSPGLFSVRFEAPELARQVAPGQFAMLELPGRIRPYLRRAYSVAQSDREERVEFLVKTVGVGTRALEELPKGSVARLLGPLGNGFSLAGLARGSRVAVIAGGIGAAPFPFLLRELAAADVEADLFWGGRSAADLAFEQRLSHFVTGRLHLATEDGSLGSRGFVTEVFREAARDAAYVRVFACGPMPMFAALAPIVAALGVRAEFSTEADMGCGFGVCLGCVLPATEKRFIVSCTEGPVLAPEAIDWGRIAPAGADSRLSKSESAR
jgi:dihydroorotate dehydrogenase electron transfer subunit